MTVAIVFGIAVFLIGAALLSRQASKTKKQAIADLEREKEKIGTFDIFSLIESEVDELGLVAITGAEDIPHGVLLKVWSDNQHVVESCAGIEHLRYLVKEGVSPAQATEPDVTLICDLAEIEE